MTPHIIIGLLIGIPVILALALRVSSIFLFASLMSGSLLLQFLGDDISFAASILVSNVHVPLIAHLTVLLLPSVMTLFILRKTLLASSVVFHFIPLVFMGLTVAVLTLPLLPSGLQAEIFSTEAGNLLRVGQDDIIGLAVLLHLLLLWFSFRKNQDKHHGKHHK